MNAKIKLHFYAKSTKMNNSGKLPIYVRVTINGERFEFSSKKYIEKTKWSSEQSRMKGSSEESRSINGYLDMIRSKVLDTELKLLHKEEFINIENFQNHLLGKNEKRKMLIPIFEDHNNKMKELIGQKYALGTLKRFIVTINHIKAFLELKYNLTDISIDKIDHCFITEFEFYLRSNKKCSNNTSVKNVRNFRKIIKICLNNDWLEKDPFARYDGKVIETDKEFLTEEEIQRIYNKSFLNTRLNIVKDIFIFCCFTGLAYIDVQQLKHSHIGIGIDGNKWIFKSRQKTDTKSKIPLLPIAEEIINKYSNHPKCLNEQKVLPVLSNQKMNSYLKEIGDVCGIQKEITFHMARHSFATSITLTNGVPIESVSKMLGHKSIRTTQHYAKIVDKKVSDDMAILRNKITIDNFKKQA
ncbi:site-specific integrase [Flavobacterium columnare]|uniref:site-specific integrase n=1 Tax=Flavobacterium columnare TaxID=996 RepID=UPI0040346E11